MNHKRTAIGIGAAVLGIVLLLALKSCRTTPPGAVPVKPFDSRRYLGKWYEIARKDFRFEKNLNNTTAQYSLNRDGSIGVTNRGFNYKTKEWEEATGKAKFVSSPDEAKLKVSFFGPFYAGYNVLAIDSGYNNALVVGKNTDYMWLLSRDTQMPENTRQDFLRQAEAIGIDTTDLIWVEHTK